MLIPLLSFFLGTIWLACTLIIARNKSSLLSINQWIPPQRKGYLITGNILCSSVLILGLIGYFGYLPSQELRMVRLGGGSLGILLILISIKPVTTFAIRGLTWGHAQLKSILTTLALIILLSLFLVSFFDANYGGDGLWYHFPFAARIWNFIPANLYQFEELLEYRYQGLPLLAHFFQGFFWFIFQRPEAANLFCYFSLVTFILYLRFYLNIPFYLGTISLLAIPMVHMHATKMYIDLPANIFAAIAILTLYKGTVNHFSFSRKEILILLSSSILAANMKFQTVPVIFIITFIFLIGTIIKIYLNNDTKEKYKFLTSIKVTVLVFVASLFIFFTCVKNIVLYQNPFYPMKLEVAGVVLNHEEVIVDEMHPDLRKLPTLVRWSKSLLEIGAFDERRPWPWTLGMDFVARNEKTFGVGGYFGGYVIFNILLLAYLSWRFWEKETKYSLIFLIPLSLFTAYLPDAYKLRFYLYWMLTLVGLNTYLCHYFYQKYKSKFINPVYFALVAAGFMFAFMVATRYWFTIPHFSGFNQQVQRTDIIDQDLLTQIKKGDDVCIVGAIPHTILYSSYFYENSTYSVTAEYNIPEIIERRCRNKKILIK